MMKRIKHCIMGMAAASLALLVSGCAATSVPVVGNMTPAPTETLKVTETPTETPIAIITTSPKEEATPVPVSLTPIAEADDHLKTIGVKMEGEAVLKVKLVNRTGKAITGIYVIPEAAGSDREEWEFNRMPAEDRYEDKEERILYYNTADDPADENGEKHYDVKLFFEDETSYLMLDVPLYDIEEGVMYLENDMVYITYLSASANKQLSTREQELASAARRKELEEEEARRLQEEADRYEEDEDDDAYEEEWDYEDRYEEDPYDDYEEDEGDYDEYDAYEDYDPYEDYDDYEDWVDTYD